MAWGGAGAAVGCLLVASILTPTCILTNRMGLLEYVRHLAVTCLLGPALVLGYGLIAGKGFATATSRRSFLVVASACLGLSALGFTLQLIQRLGAA